MNFRAWLFYGNKHFEGDLHRIESGHGDIPKPSVDGEAAEVQARCSQLYSILTGLLRGPGAHHGDLPRAHHYKLECRQDP